MDHRPNYHRDYYLAHKEKIIAYARQWQKDNPEKVKEIAKRRKPRKLDPPYRKKYYGKNRIKILQQHRDYFRQNPEKVKAWGIAHYNIKDLEKCASCGSQEKLVRQHPDYSEPLKVIILCQSCHLRLHWRGDIIGTAVFTPKPKTKRIVWRWKARMIDPKQAKQREIFDLARGSSATKIRLGSRDSNRMVCPSLLLREHHNFCLAALRKTQQMASRLSQAQSFLAFQSSTKNRA